MVSILIGINDLWHKMEGRYAGIVHDYETGYRQLLEKTRRALPGADRDCASLSSCAAARSPDVGFRSSTSDGRRRRARWRSSERPSCPFRPSSIEPWSGLGSPEYWAADGVTRPLQGHQLMADAWLSRGSWPGPSRVTPGQRLQVLAR